jgi:hypothetical protein
MTVGTISREGYRSSRIASDSNSTAKETARTPRKPKPSTTKAQIEREALFWKVTLAYRESSQSLVSQNPDVTVCSMASDFVRDVESATQFALQGKGLFPEWQRLAKDDVWQVPRVMRQIIGPCARVYRERGLQPDRYFTTSGRGSERPSPRSVLRTHTRVRCREHGVQAVTHRFPNPDGDIMRLKCGCDRRLDIAAAVPVSGAVVNIATPPIVAANSTSDSPSMPEELGIAA